MPGPEPCCRHQPLNGLQPQLESLKCATGRLDAVLRDQRRLVQQNGRLQAQQMKPVREAGPASSPARYLLTLRRAVAAEEAGQIHVSGMLRLSSCTSTIVIGCPCSKLPRAVEGTALCEIRNQS